MRTKKILVTLAVAAACALGVLSLSSTSTEAETIAGDFYVWVANNRADNRQATCDSLALGRDCVELCYNLNGITPGDRYCCIDPTYIGGQDNPEECDLWLN